MTFINSIKDFFSDTFLNKAEHAVQSYTAGIGGQGARNYGLHSQYAEQMQCIYRATLPIGVNDGRKRRKEKKRRRNRRFLELPRPMAGS